MSSRATTVLRTFQFFMCLRPLPVRHCERSEAIPPRNRIAASASIHSNGRLRSVADRPVEQCANMHQEIGPLRRIRKLMVKALVLQELDLLAGALERGRHLLRMPEADVRIQIAVS